MLISRIVSDNKANSPISERILHSYMMSAIIHGAIYRSVAVLGSAVNLIRQRGQSFDRHPALLKLYNHVLGRMHDALHCPGTAKHDDIVLSISGLMCMEAFYGSKEHYQVHLHGLTAMSSVRGGPWGVALMTMTTWLTTNSAEPTRSRRLLDDTR